MIPVFGQLDGGMMDFAKILVDEQDDLTWGAIREARVHTALKRSRGRNVNLLWNGELLAKNNPGKWSTYLGGRY